MRTKFALAALLLLGGLALGQTPQDELPCVFLKNNEPPMSPVEFQRDNDDLKARTLSQMETQQTASPSQQVWVARYKVTPDNHIHDIAVDPAGEVYITGSIKPRINSSIRNLFIIKYNTAGVKQWEAFYNGPARSDVSRNAACALKLVADFDRNIYAAGWSASAVSNSAYTTLKYDLFGNLQWASLYHANSQHYNDYASDFVVDNWGNVYVTGGSIGETGTTEYATVKYDKTGKELWVARYHGGSKNYGSYAFSIALDGAGNVCVTGISSNTIGNFDYTTIMYNPNGISKWVAYYKGPRNADDQAHALAIDAVGNVYVAGSSSYRDKGWQMFATTVKYNVAGAQQWIAKHHLPAGTAPDHFNFKLWVDKAQNVYLTGSGISALKFTIIKYNKAGAMQWVKSYPEENEGVAKVNDMYVDDLGNIYVTGTSRTSSKSNDDDYVTIKYDTAGRMQWLLRYNGLQNGRDQARALAVDGSGNVYVTGLSGSEIVTIKYSQSLTDTPSLTNVWANRNNEKKDDVLAPEINLPNEFYLSPNHPNPFNPGTTIRFGLPQTSHVTLKVYNVLSEEVATLIDGQRPAGVHAVDFTPKQDLPSGIYFYVLEAGAVRLVQRMVYAK